MDPKAALAELTLSLSEAFHCGAQGRVACGYLILTCGLMRARGASPAEAPRMVELWERAMAQFRERFPNDGYLDCREFQGDQDDEWK